MAKLKFVIHPLFFIFGLYFAFTGKVYSFLLTVLCAILHELGHFFASERCGYKLNKIVLMPYGAVISGDDFSPFAYSDEIAISLAGPLTNYALALFFVALWWLCPEIYVFTDYIVMTNVAIATVNLLPCYPLDGGRVLLATLAIYMTRRKAVIICKIISFVFASFLFGLFIYSCFNAVNFTILFFGLFVLTSLKKSTNNSYIRIYADLNFQQFKRGVECKNIAICDSANLKELYRLVGTRACQVTLIDDKGKVVETLNPIKVQKLLCGGDLYLSIKENRKKIF